MDGRALLPIAKRFKRTVRYARPRRTTNRYLASVYRGQTSISRGLAPPQQRPSSNVVVAKSAKRTLVYHDYVTLDPGVGSYTQNKYRANSCYDPDLTGGGHQPMGFDQWMAMYKKFCVIGARISVTPTTPNSASNQIPGYLCILLSSDGNAGSAIASATGFWETQHRISGIVNYGEGGGLAWNYPPGNTATGNFSAKKFFGVKSLIGNQLYAGDAGANPSTGAYFEVTAFHNTGNNPAACTFEVHIEYEVVFTEPYPLGGS